ncbi:MAG TPA: ABC transporter permease [Gemmatimonadaceae bacterium]|nr:ABC transporter permease [Gemmatimonadaceae bacterium]
MSLLHAARARLRLLFARREAEARMNEELRFHVDMETERLVREERLDPAEARRRARLALGLVDLYKDQMRDGRGLAWLGGLSLDLKLGFRMLVKYPGLTLVGGFAMAFAVWVGVIVFEMVGVVVDPTLPLPGGDRVVQVGAWDVAMNEKEPRVIHDFLAWRRALTTVTDLGASRDVELNLVGADGDARPVVAAEVTASAFRIAPDRPALGRTLVASDELAGAPPVAVIGWEVWRARFAADSQVVGRSVRLGDGFATVVGVMPKGFAFPESHELWTPLHAEALDEGPRAGPPVRVFGRLADGATLDAARAELAALGRSAAAEQRATHEHLVPRVVRYTASLGNPSVIDRALMISFNLFAVLLLVLICGNVALLLFARAATRDVEIVVRAALGASRRRIVGQLFAEALVLSGVATVVGLAVAGVALQAWGKPFLERNIGRLPFWMDPHLSPAAIAYACGLAVFSAAIAGVLPALKVTRGLGSQLRQGAAGAGGVRFGGVWTAVIVAQVAVTVAIPAIAQFERRELERMRAIPAGFASSEYLGVSLEMDSAAVPAPGAPSASHARFAAALETVRRRLAAEPGVEGVTFADRMPRMYHREQWAELDDPAAGSGQAVTNPGYEVNTARVDPSYFAVLEAPVVSGRAFRLADLAKDAHVAIVDRGFVDQVLKGRNPIGRRVRLSESRTRDAASRDDARPWYEIVGVVPDIGMGHVAQSGRPAGLYLPAAPERAAGEGAVFLMVHVRGDPMALVPRLRTIATAVDATLRISDVQRLDEVENAVFWILGMWLRITLVLTGVAILLSLAGIYAVLSFTVARRTREIGVRVALGATRHRVIAAIFRRPLTQVGFGVVTGGIVVGTAAWALSGWQPDRSMSQSVPVGLSLDQVAALVAYVVCMFAVCLLACIVPTRRALGVEPTEALRAE